MLQTDPLAAVEANVDRRLVFAHEPYDVQIDEEHMVFHVARSRVNLHGAVNGGFAFAEEHTQGLHVAKGYLRAVHADWHIGNNDVAELQVAEGEVAQGKVDGVGTSGSQFHLVLSRYFGRVVNRCSKIDVQVTGVVTHASLDGSRGFHLVAHEAHIDRRLFLAKEPSNVEVDHEFVVLNLAAGRENLHGAINGRFALAERHAEGFLLTETYFAVLQSHFDGGDDDVAELHFAKGKVAQGKLNRIGTIGRQFYGLLARHFGFLVDRIEGNVQVARVESSTCLNGIRGLRHGGSTCQTER